MENEGRTHASSEDYADTAGTEKSHVGRRQVGLQVGLGALLLQDSFKYPAEAITLQEATPARYVSGELPAAEAATANLFETNTYSVVNVFDLTTRNLAASAAQVDVPEGNGSGDAPT
ncbi:trypsin protease [Cymbomonas tetramitiformis]|uniref:Trypsin protease n=1 Tax=Cymbomonas tetramitiformis TaxID=36881 RepID=A0AAE0EVR8_9CHLO|nr:trypsin protease [Cymbomonas tetramitiformis]